MVTNTSSDIGFGPVADIFLTLGDQALTKSTVTSLLTAGNAVMKGQAALCPKDAACAFPTPKIDVFYNISVSIQNR
jgi:hypothetical protein